MRSIGEVIRARRRDLGVTLQAIADMAGCTKSYLSEIENDRRPHPPSQEMLERLERALRIPSGELVSLGQLASTPADVRARMADLEAGRDETRRLLARLRAQGVDALHESGELERLIARLESGGGGVSGADASERASARGGGGISFLGALPRRVPVINKVAAGYPAEFTDLGYPARIADEYVTVPDVYDEDAFAARVVGDSMAPKYSEGDIVVFSPQADARAGSDCFVRFERDQETTFKRVYFEQDAARGALIRLQPLNSAYPPRVVPREDVAGMYAAVYVIRPVGEE